MVKLTANNDHTKEGTKKPEKGVYVCRLHVGPQAHNAQRLAVFHSGCLTARLKIYKKHNGL